MLDITLATVLKMTVHFFNFCNIAHNDLIMSGFHDENSMKNVTDSSKKIVTDNSKKTVTDNSKKTFTDSSKETVTNSYTVRWNRSNISTA